MYASSDLVEIDECDEHQHTGDSYQCEDRRLSELYDDPSICGKKMVVIRWNPHSYTPPEGVSKLSLIERPELMVELKRHLRVHPPKHVLFVRNSQVSISNGFILWIIQFQCDIEIHFLELNGFRKLP